MKTSVALPRPEEDSSATLLWCVMALLVPRATLFGELTPFGVGLAACAGAANLPTLLCLTVGYLLAAPLYPLRSVLTVGLVGAVRWVLAVLPEWGRRRFVPPLLAFVCSCATGWLVLAPTGADLYRVLLILAESCVAAGAALFFGPGMEALHRRPGEACDQTALILTGAVAVMAASTVEVGGFSPGRVAAAFMVLLLARSGRETGGSIAGCILGGAMALTAPGRAPLAVALAVGGLTAGLFSRLGRWCQSALFLLAAGVVTLGESSEGMLYYIVEIAAACLLFALLPREWERRLGRLLIRSRDLPAVEGVRRLTILRLRVASGALQEVADAVEAVSRRLRRHEGQGLSDEARQRLQELQRVVEGQFAGTGELLEGLAGRLERPGLVDVELSEQVAALCGDYGLAVVDALCTRDEGNRLTVDMLLRDGGINPGLRWKRQMEQLCGCAFATPTMIQWGEQVQVVLSELPRYGVERGVAQLCCAGERLCGDTVQVQTVGGRVLVVLSDGMGSGGRAAVDSAMAAGMTAHLWAAGFPPAAVLRMANAALQVKSREESLATLDVLTVDTHTGRMDSYKAGAATTLLRSRGRVSRLDRPGLPVGILPQVGFEHSHDHLSDGDILLLVSDGALTGGLAMVEELLRDFPADGDLEELAQAVCATAREAEAGHPDDITAVALRVRRRGGDFS